MRREVNRPPPRIVLVTPAPPRSRAGNRTTALRWAALLRRLGAHVRVATAWRGEPCDLLVAVHAVKSLTSLQDCAARSPTTARIVVLAGTDIYPTFHPDRATLAALESAGALVALQPNAGKALPPHLRAKVRTIVQSATAVPAHRQAPPFRACVLAHLRPVKDPLLPFAALARRPDLQVELVLAGEALTDELAGAAQAAVAADPRTRWLGELPRGRARELLATSHVCIVPSASEGGANVLSEAIAAGTPVLATRVDGNTGLLGDDWPGLFSAGDAAGLAELLGRAAGDPAFYQQLVERTRQLQPLVDPAREAKAWARLCEDVGVPLPGGGGSEIAR